jgi:hypothetical protein
VGEYILLDGREIKLGTCEELYYVRYSQLHDWVTAGRTAEVPGNLSPAAYLLPNSGFRFRFPFPDEDGMDLGGVADFNRGFTLSAPTGFLDSVTHGNLYHSVTPKGSPHGGYHFNVWYPCPLSTAFAEQKVVQHSPLPSNPVIQIVHQKLVGDQLWTVARCAYCGAAFRFDAEDALSLIEHERSIYGEIRHVELFRRMLAGYGHTLQL